MKRRRTHQPLDTLDPKITLAQEMGLFNDPIQELGGLVNLLNALGEEDRFNAELGLRQKNMTQEDQQFEQSMQLQRDELRQRELAEEGDAQRWTEEFGLRKFLETEDRKARVAEAAVTTDYRNRDLAATVLGLPARYQDPLGQPTVDSSALMSLLPPGMEGLAKFFTPPTTPSEFVPANADQAEKYAKRKAAGF